MFCAVRLPSLHCPVCIAQIALHRLHYTDCFAQFALHSLLWRAWAPFSPFDSNEPVVRLPRTLAGTRLREPNTCLTCNGLLPDFFPEPDGNLTRFFPRWMWIDGAKIVKTAT